MKTKILILSIAAALPSALVFAQGPGGPGGPPPPPRDGDQGRRMERPERNRQRDGEQPRGPQRPMPVPFLHALDTDDDGIISADEIKNAPDALKKLDKNGDGKLTPDEWRPQPPGGPRDGADAGKGDGPKDGDPRDGGRPKGGPRDGEARNGGPKPANEDGVKGSYNKPQGDGERPPGPPPPPLLEALDTDHDGVISADEIAKSSESLGKLDKNNDGQLGPREYGPKPPQGPPEAGKNGGHPPKPEAKPGT